MLNKWDRCLHPTAGGVRPDEDLLRDLNAEGFENPLLFRTAAQHWVDHPQRTAPIAGEQFRDLVHWLEMGLSRLEIEAIKARRQPIARPVQRRPRLRPAAGTGRCGETHCRNLDDLEKVGGVRGRAAGGP